MIQPQPTHYYPFTYALTFSSISELQNTRIPILLDFEIKILYTFLFISMNKISSFFPFSFYIFPLPSRLPAYYLNLFFGLPFSLSFQLFPLLSFINFLLIFLLNVLFSQVLHCFSLYLIHSFMSAFLSYSLPVFSSLSPFR